MGTKSKETEMTSLKKHKVNIAFSIVAMLVLAAGVIAGMFLLRQPQDIREKAAGETSIYITPSNLAKAPGETFTVTVVMTTGQNQITGVDIDLNYDPNGIQIDTITQGSGIAPFAQEIRNTIDNVAGHVAYSSFTLNTGSAVSGTLDVLIVNGTVKSTAQTGDYSISFASSTAAAAVGEGQNVINSTTGATVQVAPLGPTATLTPTETPIPTLSPTETPKPTESPTPIPTAPGTGGTGSEPTGSGGSSTSSTTSGTGKIGDANGDGKVNILDFSILLSSWGKSSINAKADLNGDGKVNILDLSILLSNWNK